MEWADVTAIPSSRKLRQFAGLLLLFFGTLAAWRALHGRQGFDVLLPAALGVVVGGLGMVRPAAIRLIYTGWMIAAFPLGWTISRLMLAGLFFVVFTPVAVAFRVAGRDVLRLQPRRDRSSCWTPKASVGDVREYFRQF